MVAVTATGCSSSTLAMLCRLNPMLIHMATVRQHILQPAMACPPTEQLMEELMQDMASKFSTSNRLNINSK